jgi:hypothetical protein
MRRQLSRIRFRFILPVLLMTVAFGVKRKRTDLRLRRTPSQMTQLRHKLLVVFGTPRLPLSLAGQERGWTIPF